MSAEVQAPSYSHLMGLPQAVRRQGQDARECFGADGDQQQQTGPETCRCSHGAVAVDARGCPGDERRGYKSAGLVASFLASSGFESSVLKVGFSRVGFPPM
jgi:hypothetical protein